MSDLRNQTIVITGASAGIGAATAIECGKAGMNVVVSARRLDRCEEVAKQVEQAGGQALAVRCDVQSDEDVAQLVEQSRKKFGRIDAFFANAGYGIFQRVDTSTEEQVRDIFETNFHGTMRCIRAVVPIMREQGHGHLLICSSAVSEIGIPMYGIYAATKAAQDSIAGAMRAELYGQNIKVSSVHPIGTRTDFFDVVHQRATPQPEGYNTPSTQPHTGETVARAVVKCLRKPKSEVWPSVGARLGLAVTTAFPGIAAMAMRDLYKKRYKKMPDDNGKT